MCKRPWLRSGERVGWLWNAMERYGTLWNAMERYGTLRVAIATDNFQPFAAVFE